MNILALDTSSSSGSIAIQKDGKLVFSSYLDIRVTHSERLMPMIDFGLKNATLSVRDLNAIALVNGPGSFTGIRIGLATAKGLSYGLEIPIIPVYANEILAMNVIGFERNIATIIDARMNEIYAAIYDPNLDAVIKPHNTKPEAFSAFLNDSKYIVIGSGYEAYKERFEFHNNIAIGIGAQHRIQAEKILDFIKYKKLEIRYDFEKNATLEPYYLRKSQAELVKAQKEAK